MVGLLNGCMVGLLTIYGFVHRFGSNQQFVNKTIKPSLDFDNYEKTYTPPHSQHVAFCIYQAE